MGVGWSFGYCKRPSAGLAPLVHPSCKAEPRAPACASLCPRRPLRCPRAGRSGAWEASASGDCSASGNMYCMDPSGFSCTSQGWHFTVRARGL